MMAAAGSIRTCENPNCAIAFTPHDGRQRFHSFECEKQFRNAKRWRCPTCKTPRPNMVDRFCGNDCKNNYRPAQGRRPVGLTVVIHVLLPLGSAPRRAAINPYAGELPVRKVFCRRYERCLAYAESKRWPGFSCDNCEVNEQVPPVGWGGNKKTNWEP